jgi:hypothetical protein
MQHTLFSRCGRTARDPGLAECAVAAAAAGMCFWVRAPWRCGWYQLLGGMAAAATARERGVRSTPRASPNAAHKVHLEFVVRMLPSHLAAVAANMNEVDFRARSAHAASISGAQHAAVKGATWLQRFACAACGVLPAPGAALHQIWFCRRECAACMAVTHCGPACQRAHWRMHRKDCKLLRKPMEPPPAMDKRS